MKQQTRRGFMISLATAAAGVTGLAGITLTKKYAREHIQKPYPFDLRIANTQIMLLDMLLSQQSQKNQDIQLECASAYTLAREKGRIGKTEVFINYRGFQGETHLKSIIGNFGTRQIDILYDDYARPSQLTGQIGNEQLALEFTEKPGIFEVTGTIGKHSWNAAYQKTGLELKVRGKGKNEISLILDGSNSREECARMQGCIGDYNINLIYGGDGATPINAKGSIRPAGIFAQLIQ